MVAILESQYLWLEKYRALLIKSHLLLDNEIILGEEDSSLF